jgi:hypothetical protein
LAEICTPLGKIHSLSLSVIVMVYLLSYGSEVVHYLLEALSLALVMKNAW